MSEFSEAWEAMNDVRWAAIARRHFAGARLEHLDEPLRTQLTAWVESPTNVLLFGPTGVGKTYAAYAAARARFDRGDSVECWSSSALLDALRPGGALDRLDPVLSVDLLVLDDIGAQKDSEWAYERLDLLIDSRFLDELPTVCTSNFAPKELSARVSGRFWSRLAGADAIVCRVTGSDRRMESA